VIESVGKQEDNKGARIFSCAPLVDRLEFSGVLELEKPRQFLVVLNRNALASLVTPSFQNQSATLRLHPRAKTMRLCSMPIVWLVRSLWHFPRCSQKDFTVASGGEARQFWCSANSLLSVEMKK
jgi:hypothetical protein